LIIGMGVNSTWAGSDTSISAPVQAGQPADFPSPPLRLALHAPLPLMSTPLPTMRVQSSGACQTTCTNDLTNPGCALGRNTQGLTQKCCCDDLGYSHCTVCYTTVNGCPCE
jgi:hypothetical protein